MGQMGVNKSKQNPDKMEVLLAVSSPILGSGCILRLVALPPELSVHRLDILSDPGRRALS